MCPSIAVLAGGGDGGGGSGESAGDGSGDNNAGGSGSGEAAEGDQRGAPDYQKYPICGFASHPVDVVTGRAFTHPIADLTLPGPLLFELKRMYSSKASKRDMGLGPGWAHTLGWEIEVQRRRITVWNEQGIAVDFPVIPVGGETLGPWGWVLRRETWGFAVDANDGLWHLFSAGDEAGKRFRMTAIQDRNKNRIALTYEDERLVEITDSAGRRVRVLHTKEGRIASFQAKNAVAEGRWIAFATYAYDDRGRLASVTDADGFTARYAYDDDDRLTDDADRTGLTFHFRYDGEGRCIESWGDYPGQRDPSLIDDLPKYLHDGVTRVKGIHHCKFEYFAEGYSEVADSTEVRRFFGNVHGTLSKRVEGGAVVTASYRDDGHLLALTDPLGGTTSFDRDARGRILKVTDPLGRTTAYDRDVAGLPIAMIDPAGGITTLERDRFGNLVVHTDPTGAVTSATYDGRGALAEVVDPRGGRTKFTHDEQGNLTELIEPNGAVWRYGYDALGRLVEETDPFSAKTRYAYTGQGDLAAVFDAAGGTTRYTYDGERHLTQIVDPRGHVTAMVWGGYNRLCERKDASGHAVRLGYSVDGKLIVVRNERGEEHRFEYDSAGWLIGEKTADGRELRYKNDALGRQIRTTSGLGEKTVLTYDLAGQLIARELPDGSTHELSYDGRGEITAARWPEGEVRFERDAMGRIVREVQTVGEEEHSVEITYDPADARSGRRTSLGHTEVVERDASGSRRRTVLNGDHVIEHRCDLVGRETARGLQGGGRIESLFDPMGRLSRRRVLEPTLHRSMGRDEPAWLGEQAGGVVAERAYRYDWDGELIEAWDKQHGRTEYQYDPVGQLMAMVPEKARGELFRHDPAGNLFEASTGAKAREYGKGNRLIQRGDTAYSWDGDGRLAEKVVKDPATGGERRWQYRWNGAGLLSGATGPDGTVVELTYDPFARRLQKRVSRQAANGGRPVPIATTRFVWDGDVLVHEIRRAARAGGDPVVDERTYCFEDDGFEPVAHRESRRDDVGLEHTAWFHYVNDPSGAPQRLIAEDGAIACDLRLGAWGSVEVLPGAKASTPLRSQGQYEDAETGLSYNRYRYYDSETGTFISADPSGLHGGTNVFRAPVNLQSWIDPLGLNGNKKGPRPEPGRAGANLNPSNQGGVTIQSHGTNDVDRPAHAHVNGDEGNKDCRIGPDGKPQAGQRALTKKEAAAVAANLPAIKKELRKVGRSAARLEAEGNLPGAENTSKKK
jgi:RHS repeat-associated protein